MKKYILLSLALVACSQVNPVVVSDVFCDEEFDYCIDKKMGFENSLWSPSIGMHGRETAHTVSNGRSDSDSESIYMEIYNNSVCPITLHHMEQVQSLNGTRWGKVVWKPSDDPYPGQNDVFCPDRMSVSDTPSFAYAFCAQKDDKAVAICIQQVTDNPELAKEIFESFRWTD